MKNILVAVFLLASFWSFSQSDLEKDMAAVSKLTLDALAKADTEAKHKVEAQEARIKIEIEAINKAAEKQIKELKEANDKLIKEFEKEVPKAEKEDLSKMTEAKLVEYGKNIGADVDMKYSKAKNIENIKAKQLK